MSDRKVIANRFYRFYPVLMDIVDSRTKGVNKGDIVEVVNLPGCPPANTMGMCHIKLDGKFAGLVCTNSLQEV